MTEVLDDLKVKELEDGSLQVGEPEPEPKEEAEGESGGDERLTKTEENDDEAGHSEETEEEAKARTERNRARRAQNKASRKEYVESLKRDLASRDSIINDLASRVAAVEQHSTGNQVAQIDAAITEAANFYNHFKTVNQKAIELADGAFIVTTTPADPLRSPLIDTSWGLERFTYFLRKVQDYLTTCRSKGSSTKIVILE